MATTLVVRQPPTTATPPRRTSIVRATRLPIGAMCVAAVVSVLLRLRMYWTPISSDEAGFLVIARSWAHGHALYRDVWVDRPQGIILLYRMWDWASGGSVASIRIMAMAFGVVLVVAVASVATRLAGASAGAIAALLVAATSANPAIEGHLANGELLGGAVAVAGLAVGLRAIVTGRSQLLVVSGVLAGLALSLKQSGFEGFGTLMLWLVFAPAFGWRTKRAALRDIGALCSGLAIVVATLMVDGVRYGWSRWWYAVVAHRFEERSAVSGPTWGRLWSTFLVAGPILAPLVTTCGVAWLIRRSPRSAPIRSTIRVPYLLGIWTSVVAVAFVLGGNFFRHYWLSWCPVLAVAAGVALARLMTRRVAMFAALALLLPGLLAAASILELDRSHSGATASDDIRLAIDEPIAAWFHSVRAPGDGMYAMCASPGFYADAGIDPQTPYLWRDHIHMYPGAIDQIATMLDGPARPRFIALYQSTTACDPSGRLGRIVDDLYVPRTVVAGTLVLERRGVDVG